MASPTDGRDRPEHPKHGRGAWLVVVRVEPVAQEPWLPLTDWPVVNAAAAVRVFRMHRTRWAAETGLETMKAWGPERFTVRAWIAAWLP